MIQFSPLRCPPAALRQEGTLEPAQTGLIPAPAHSQLLSVQDLSIVLPGRAGSASSDLAKNPNFSTKGTQEVPFWRARFEIRNGQGPYPAPRIAGSCTSSEATGFDHTQGEELSTDTSLNLPSLDFVSLVLSLHISERSLAVFSL